MITGMRRAAAGVPYSTAAYMTSVYIATVARLPWVHWSATRATVPTARAVRGAVLRSSSAADTTTSGISGRRVSPRTLPVRI